MDSKQTHMIIRIRDMYQPDLQGSGNPEIIETGLTLAEALERVAGLDDEPYCTMHNEAGRPEYIIALGNGGSVGDRIGYDDDSMYDWDDCSCAQGEDGACGECQTCNAMRIDQNVSLAKSMAVAQ
jgi:hypothetical protein